MKYTSDLRRAFLAGKLNDVKQFHRAAFLAQRRGIYEELAAEWKEHVRDKSKDKLYRDMAGILGGFGLANQAMVSWLGSVVGEPVPVPDLIARMANGDVGGP